jgi:hypothetical protein
MFRNTLEEIMYLTDGIYPNGCGLGYKPTKYNISGGAITFDEDEENGTISNIKVDLDDFANDLKYKGDVLSINQLEKILDKIDNNFNVDKDLWENVDMIVTSENNLFDKSPSLYTFDDLEDKKLSSEQKQELKDAIISYQKNELIKYINDRKLKEGILNEPDEEEEDDEEDDEEEDKRFYIPTLDEIQYFDDNKILFFRKQLKKEIEGIIDSWKYDKTSKGKDKYGSWSNFLKTELGQKLPDLIEKLNKLYTTKHFSISNINVNKDDDILEETNKKPTINLKIPRHEQLYQKQEKKRLLKNDIEDDFNDIVNKDDEIKKVKEDVYKKDNDIFTDLYGNIEDIEDIPNNLERENCNNSLFEKNMMQQDNVLNIIKQVDNDLYKSLKKIYKSNTHEIQIEKALSDDKIKGLGDRWAPIDGMIDIYKVDKKTGDKELVEKVNIEFKYYSNYDIPSKGNLSFELMYDTIENDYDIYRKELIIYANKLKEKISNLNDDIKVKEYYNEDTSKDKQLILTLQDEYKRLNLNNKDFLKEDFYLKHYTAQVPMKFSKTGVKRNIYAPDINSMNSYEDYNYLNSFLKPSQKQLIFENGKIKDIKRLSGNDIINKKTNQPKYERIKGKYYMVVAFKDAIIGLNYSDQINKGKINPENPLLTNKLVKTAYANKVSDHIGLKLWEFKPIYMKKTLKTKLTKRNKYKK